MFPMRKNLELRYLILKRITAYSPGTLFLRKSILRIAKERELLTIGGLVHTTNRVLIFLSVSSCSISIIEAIYFFSVEEEDKIKLHWGLLLYILGLDFALIALIKFTTKLVFKFTKGFLVNLRQLPSQIRILRRSLSIRSVTLFLISFLKHVMRNSVNILTLPITGIAFILDKILEPIEIRVFYRPMAITIGSPFFFN